MSDYITLWFNNNDGLGQKLVYVFVIFPCFKVFINIHKYANQIKFTHVTTA